MSRPVTLSITGISALTKLDKAAVSRMATAGKFGVGLTDPGQKRKRYHLATIEQTTGKTFTAEQIEQAKDAHSYRGPTNPEINTALRVRMMRRLVDAIDDQWKAALVGQKLVNFVPPTRGTSNASKP